jgi:hypothetical protein
MAVDVAQLCVNDCDDAAIARWPYGHRALFAFWQVRRHMRLADQHIAHADLLQMIAQRRFADAQRPAIPVRAVRAHVAAGVE